MPAPGSNRGYRPSVLLSTFMLMKHEGAKCLEDVRHLRADAATYQAGVINYCEANDIRYVIRAKMDTSVKESMSTIKPSDWVPLIKRDGTESETEQVAHTLHVMHATPKAFYLIVQRQLKKEKETDPQPDLLPNLFLDQDDKSTQKGKYMPRALATNLDLQTNWDEHKVVHFYNQRGEASENRIKELRSDFGGAPLPCGDFGANAAYFKLCALACNLLALLRQLLPAGWESRRAITIRWRLNALAAQIVYHGRQWTLKLNRAQRQLIDEAL